MTMKELPDARVHRTPGRSAGEWTHETSEVRVGRDGHKLDFRFELGKGTQRVTIVSMDIGADGFAAILLSMLKADRHRAMSEMAEVLNKAIAEQPHFDEVMARKGREAVVEAVE